jgi:phage N-6-adenine-methyltransferase
VTLSRFKAVNHPQQVAKRGSREDIDDRATHHSVFEPLHRRFDFTIDVAASPANTKCSRFFSKDDDGLTKRWSAERVWCSPPYSCLKNWVGKAWVEWTSKNRPELIVMLLPANRTEQGWWQDLVEPFRDRDLSPLRSEFIRDRIRFARPGVTAITPNERPPFGCVLLIWSQVVAVPFVEGPQMTRLWPEATT